MVSLKDHLVGEKIQKRGKFNQLHIVLPNGDSVGMDT